MITFKDWLIQQDEGWDSVKRFAKNLVPMATQAAADVAFGPETGIDGKHVLTAMQVAAQGAWTGINTPKQKLNTGRYYRSGGRQRFTPIRFPGN